MKTNFPLKQALLSASVFLFLLPCISQAQVVGGGAGQPYGNSSPSNANISDDDKYFGLSVGIIRPQGMFSQPYSFGNLLFVNLATPFGYVPSGSTSANNGLGAQTGYLLNLSGFSSLAKFSMGSGQSRLGLQYAFEFGYNPISWSNVSWSQYNMTVSTSGFLYDGLKFGPQFNINPIQNLGIGFYVTADPYLTFPGGENATYDVTDGGIKHNGTYDVSDTSVIHLNIDISAGIIFYYKALILSIEYNSIHTKYNGAIKQTETQTLANGTIVTIQPTDTHFTSVIHTNMLKFTIGVRLGSHPKGR